MAKKAKSPSPKRTGSQFVNPKNMKPPGMMTPGTVTPVKVQKGKGFNG